MTDIPAVDQDCDDTGPYTKPLYKLLREGFPDHRGRMNRLDVRSLGLTLGYSYERIYIWMRRGKLSAKNAKVIVDKSDGRISLEQLLPFVLA
jgi:hypothetical protein